MNHLRLLLLLPLASLLPAAAPRAAAPSAPPEIPRAAERQSLVLTKMPDVPEGFEISRIDMVVRLRKRR